MDKRENDRAVQTDRQTDRQTDDYTQIMLLITQYRHGTASQYPACRSAGSD